LQVNDRSRGSYLSAYNKHVKPAFGGRTLAQVAATVTGCWTLLTVIMAGLSVSPRRIARMVIEGTLDEAVKAGSCGSIASVVSNCRTTAPSMTGQISCCPRTRRYPPWRARRGSAYG
jgi:hypothetical protein